MDEEKRYLINVESNLEEYAKEAVEAREEVERLTLEMYKLKHSTTATAEDQEKAVAELSNAKKVYKDAQKNIQYLTLANKAQSGSYEQLYRQWQVAQTQLKLMGNAYTVNENGVRVLSQAYVDQSKKVAAAKKALDDFGRGVYDNRLNVGNYTDSIKAAMNEMGMIPGVTGQAAVSVSRFTKVLNYLRANPIILAITAIIGAFTGFIKILKSTDKGSTELAVRFEQLKAILDVLRQRVMHFAEAVGHLFKGEWKKAGESMRQTFSNIGEAFREATEGARRYQEELDNVRDAQGFFVARAAEMERAITKLEYTAQDRNKSLEERKKALQEAMRLGEIQLAEEKKLKKRMLDTELDYLAARHGVRSEDILGYIKMTEAEQENASESLKFLRDMEEDKLIEIAGFYAEWVNLDTQFFQANRRNISKLSGFMIQELNEMKKVSKQWVDDYFSPFVKAMNEELTRITAVEDIDRRQLRSKEEFYKRQAELIKESERLAKWETEQYILNQELKIQSSVSVLDSLSSILGEQTEAGKAFAVAAATIDTYAAANKALNDPTIPSSLARIAIMASVIMRGLANVKQIMSVKPGKTTTKSATMAASPAIRRITPTGTSIFTQKAINEQPVAKQNVITVDALASAIKKIPAPVVSVEDIQAKTASKTKVEVKARI